jgi:3-deoxy-7-phosphoheptulonate synthase
MEKIKQWKNFEFKNNPFEDKNIEQIKNKLKCLDNIVKIEEIIQLKQLLSSECLVLQIGECAETFNFSDYKYIKNKYEFLIQCGLIIQNKIINENNVMNVIKIGRIAGQFAKPRSDEKEIVDNKEILTYKGDIINHININKRKYNPYNMIKAYNIGKKIYKYLQNIKNNITFDNKFLQTINKSKNNSFKKKFFQIDINKIDKNKLLNFYTSKESLLLDFEESLTRHINGLYYNVSTHLLWLGNKNCFIGSSQIEYLKNVENPIGIKISETKKIEDIIVIIKTINPKNEKGKILLIIRINNENINQYLKELILAIQKHNINVIFSVDPMHGNTEKIANIKTRKVEKIEENILKFMEILNKYNIISKGIHLETSSSFVSECIYDGILDKKKFLQKRYITYCDPRLSPDMTIDIINKYL